MLGRDGKALAEPMAGLRRQFDPRTIHFEPLAADADLLVLRTVACVERLTPAEAGCEIRLRDGVDPAAAIRDIVSVVPPARIALARVRLEDVFIRLVSEDSPTDRALRANLQ